MSIWVVAGLLLNIAVVGAAVVLVLRFAGPSSVNGALAARAEIQRKRRSGPAPAPKPDRPRPPPLNPTDTRRVEWLALLDAFELARTAYFAELARRSQGPRRYGALAETKHALDVAKERLTRFERETVVGRKRPRPAAERERETAAV